MGTKNILHNFSCSVTVKSIGQSETVNGSLPIYHNKLVTWKYIVFLSYSDHPNVDTFHYILFKDHFH